MLPKSKLLADPSVTVSKNARSVTRRSALQLALLGSASVSLLSLSGLATARSDSTQITVWKTASCGCCKEWVAHLRKNGFEVVTNDVKDTAPYRQKLELSEKFGSCHTASLAGYVLEGHVPAQEIRRLLREKPAALGLAVPGMPVGSPGMEMGSKRDAFDVLLVLSDGSSRVYQSYPAIPSLKS
ncbi:MAG: DUF411 domain-containing protein [Polaromonas sp.]|nr:DUF411 domain-containing protein [Polaromonas sp.]